MVRHEAAEALGSLGDAAALDSLTRHKANPAVEIAETCEVRGVALKIACKLPLDGKVAF